MQRETAMWIGIAAGVAVVALVSAGPIQVHPKLPKYARTSGVSGRLISIGSDTMNNLMAYRG